MMECIESLSPMSFHLSVNSVMSRSLLWKFPFMNFQASDRLCNAGTTTQMHTLKHTVQRLWVILQSSFPPALMLIHKAAQIRFQVQAIFLGLGNDWWCLVGHKLRSPGWKSGVTFHSTLTSTPLDTFSLRKVYCSTSSAQVIWNNTDGFGLQVHPCLIPKGTLRASGWGSMAKRYVSSCGVNRVGVIVFTDSVCWEM